VGAGNVQLAEGPLEMSPPDRTVIQKDVRLWLDSIPAGDAQKGAEPRFVRLLAHRLTARAELALAKPWRELSKQSWPLREQAKLIQLLGNLGCRSPYIIRGLMRRAKQESESIPPLYAAPMAKYLLATQCEGTMGLSRHDRDSLEYIASQ
jgi:hypothetical protein